MLKSYSLNKKDFTTLSNYRRITLPSLILIFGGGVLLFSILYLLNYSFDIVDITAYLTGAVAVITLINFSKGIDNINEYNEKTLKVNKDQYSFNVVAEMHKDYMRNSLRSFREINKNMPLSETTIEQLLDYFKKNSDDEANMVQVLNYFEHISLLIKWRQVEEKIIKGSLKTLFVNTHLLTEAYIRFKQTEVSSTIWCNYTNLAKKWGKK